MEAQLAGLTACCDSMAGALASSQTATAGLVAETEALRGELAANARRSALVAEFLVLVVTYHLPSGVAHPPLQESRS